MSGSDFGWVFFAVLALFIWGVWGFMTRLVAASIGWREFTVLASIGSVSSMIVFAILTRPSISHPLSTYALTFLVGVLGFLGTPMLYAALERNPSSIVIVATSLYPLVAIILSVLILKELPTARQAVGIALAIIALILISSES
ncbi:MAG: DMT family transporter [Nitrososphaerota archaeon]|nr:DMT family transporter [Candidatus Calditenuaceae archaeon]MDW8073473.1 DMT family transporter [Nitrososphaerota archaeon]